MPTPTRKKIPASTQTVVSRTEEEFLCHNKSNESLNLSRFNDDFLSSKISHDAREIIETNANFPNAEKGFAKVCRYTNEFSSPRILHVTPKAPKSMRISPRVIIKNSLRQNISHEYNDTIDECTNSSELSSDISCSARRINVTRNNILDESSPNVPEGCSPRESVIIIEEVITLDSSSDDENQISDDMGEGVANASLDKAEYEKYLKLKEKYEGKRKPDIYSKLRAQK